MRVYELFEDDEFKGDPLQVTVTAVLSQIKSEIEDTGYTDEITTQALIRRLKENGINMSIADLIEVSKQEPWCNLLANVSAHKVVFKGDAEADGDSVDPDETSSTLDRMADRSKKKHTDDLK